MSRRTTSMASISVQRAERALLIGGTGTGKSTMAEYLIPQFWTQYKSSRILILDSKPRFRAEWEPTGLSARKRYKKWDHGAPLPGSVRLQNDADPAQCLDGAWNHARIAIAQTERQPERDWAVAVLSAFLDQARAGRPQLVYIDETLDFFHANAAARGRSDAILRTARAGRERGVALLAATQRPKGIPVQLMSEMSKLFMFRLDFADDIKYLGDMGYPFKRFPAPDVKHEFNYWDKDRRADPTTMILTGVS